MTGERTPLDRLRDAIAEGQRAEIEVTLDDVLATLLDQEEDGLDDDALQRDLRALINARYLPEAERLLEGLAVAGRTRPVNDIDRAQLLIETGRLSAAVPMLDALALRHRDNPVLFSEAKGLAGRAQKDMFLRALGGNRNAAQKHLEQAMRRYDEGLDGAPELAPWLRGNLLALNARASSAGLDVTGLVDVDRMASALEAAIAEKPESDRSFYDWSSLAEARFARADWSGAVGPVNNMLGAGDDDAFKLTSTLRQYKNMWRLPEAGPEAELIISAMERGVLAHESGGITMTREDIARQTAVDEGALQAVFGGALMRGHDWMQRYLEIGSSIAVVVDAHSGAVRGTCCLLNGDDIAPDFAGRILCMTNDHVVTEHPEAYQASHPLHPEDAAVRFTLSDAPDREYGIAQVHWSSPFDAHDTCLFELDAALPVVRSALSPVSRLPPAPADPSPNVFVISHPNSDEPSYSFQNTSLLMHDAAARGQATLDAGYLQYTTGTIKGSSGGVALNGRLQMIGLHHAGGTDMRRLDGQPGTHAANEAVWITAILNALRHDLGHGRRRWAPQANA